MSAESIIKVSGSGGVTISEGFGISVLDVVLHAVKTVIASLGKDDRLCLVQFANQGSLVLPLIRMDEVGKDAANNAIQRMYATGSTNLWDGLFIAMEQFRQTPMLRNPSIFLFTDGEPNVEPPRGYHQSLELYQKSHPFNMSINTFGFGFGSHLDSKLLKDLAVLGGGSYSFIPDASFVGTIFVNAISNLLSTMALNVHLNVYSKSKPTNKIQLLGSYHNITTKTNPGLKGSSFNLGTLNFGQDRHVVIQTGDDDLVAEVSYNNGNELTHSEAQLVPTNKQTFEIHQIRSLAVEAINQAAATLKNKDERTPNAFTTVQPPN